jgi:hypothetical protein
MIVYDASDSWSTSYVCRYEWNRVQPIYTFVMKWTSIIIVIKVLPEAQQQAGIMLTSVVHGLSLI